MKKIVGLVFGLLLTIIPFTNVFAAETIDLEDYATMNFPDTLESEGIEISVDDYKETDDQVTIYMFRGSGCGFCKSFLTFLNSIADEYGKYFKLVSFESWNDPKNAQLLTDLSAFLENPAKGVPYIIIGDQVFPGYSSEYDDSIKQVLESEYNAETRFDVIEAYNQSLEEAEKAQGASTSAVVFWNALFIVVASVAIMVHVSASNRKMLRIMGYDVQSFSDSFNDDDTKDNHNHKKIKNNKEKEL